METTVKWQGNMSFIGHSESGFDVPLDTFPAFGGENQGFRPLELMALSLAGCTAMDVISIMKKKRQVVTGFDVVVNADRAEEHPKVFTKADILYRFTGHGIDEKAVIRAIDLSATRYCPAQAMLSQVFPINLIYEIFEDQGDQKSTFVHKGQWKVDQEI